MANTNNTQQLNIKDPIWQYLGDLLKKLLADATSRKFLIAIGFMFFVLLNYVQIGGVGEFGLPYNALGLVALVSGLFIVVEGARDIIATLKAKK